jgi:hypothetical protein
LALASAICGGAALAGACNSGGPPVVPVTVVEMPKRPQAQAAPDAGAAPRTVARSKVPPPPSSEGDDDDDDMGGPDLEGGVVVGSSVFAASAQGCGVADPATVTRATPPCNDATGVAPACALPRCVSGDFPFSRDHCEDYRRYMKPKVAERAVQCLTRLGGKGICDGCGIYRCGDQALKSACPDLTADVICGQIVASCPSVNRAQCSVYLSGMNAAGRAKVRTCLADPSGCGFGLYSCVESL